MCETVPRAWKYDKQKLKSSIKKTWLKKLFHSVQLKNNDEHLISLSKTVALFTFHTGLKCSRHHRTEMRTWSPQFPFSHTGKVQRLKLRTGKIQKKVFWVRQIIQVRRRTLDSRVVCHLSKSKMNATPFNYNLFVIISGQMNVGFGAYVLFVLVAFLALICSLPY